MATKLRAARPDWPGWPSLIRTLTGLDTAGARALTKHLIARGELVTTGQKRGTRYHLPEDTTQ